MDRLRDMSGPRIKNGSEQIKSLIKLRKKVFEEILSNKKYKDVLQVSKWQWSDLKRKLNEIATIYNQKISNELKRVLTDELKKLWFESDSLLAQLENEIKFFLSKIFEDAILQNS